MRILSGSLYKGGLNFPAPMGGSLQPAGDKKIQKVDLEDDDDNAPDKETQTDDLVRGIKFKIISSGKHRVRVRV